MWTIPASCPTPRCAATASGRRPPPRPPRTPPAEPHTKSSHRRAAPKETKEPQRIISRSTRRRVHHVRAPEDPPRSSTYSARPRHPMAPHQHPPAAKKNDATSTQGTHQQRRTPQSQPVRRPRCPVDPRLDPGGAVPRKAVSPRATLSRQGVSCLIQPPPHCAPK